MFLSAIIEDGRSASMIPACIDSIDERGLTAVCPRTFLRGWPLVVTLRGGVQVAGRVVRSGHGRVDVAFRTRVDLDRLLHPPALDTVAFARPWTPPIAGRGWRPGLRERFFG